MRLTQTLKEWMSIALMLGTDNMNRFDTCYDWIKDEDVVIAFIADLDSEDDDDIFDAVYSKIDDVQEEIYRRCGMVDA